MYSKTGSAYREFAAVFTKFNYTEIPFERLNQLEKAGILNIYIVVSNDEFKQSQNKRFEVFDSVVSKTILEHYKSHRSESQLKFHVLNSGELSSEKEKLRFYLENVKEQYLINLFFYENDIPGLNQNLKSIASVRREVITEFYFMPFFKWTSRIQIPIDEFTFSPLVINLLKREVNPCFAYKMGKFDISHSQWLFNIFIELTIFRISNKPVEDVQDCKKELIDLMKQFDRNIINLQKAEENFAKTHKSMYGSFEEPSFLTKWYHQSALSKKDYYEEQFSKIIEQTISLYEDITNYQMLSNKKPTSLEFKNA